MGIYFDNSIYGIRVVLYDGAVLYEIVSDKKLSDDQIKIAQTYVSDNTHTFVYLSTTTTHDYPVKTTYMWVKNNKL